MTLRIMLLLGAFAVPLAACGAKTPSAEATTDATASDAMAADTAAPDAMGSDGAMKSDMAMAAAPAMSAPDFVAAAAASDTFEIDSSRLALAKSKNADVTGFAKMMVADHTKSTAALKHAAAEASPPLTVAPKLTVEQHDNLAKLKAASAADFDAMYGAMQVAGHEKALAAMRSYADGGDVASLKAFAATTAPTVSGHLDKAKSLPQ